MNGGLEPEIGVDAGMHDVCSRTKERLTGRDMHGYHERIALAPRDAIDMYRLLPYKEGT